jgi:hypothetical protein
MPADGVVCGGLDTKRISLEDVLVLGAQNNPDIWVKATVLEKIYKTGNSPQAVIIFDNACLTTLCEGNTEFNRSLMLMHNMHIIRKDDAGGIIEDPKESGKASICGDVDKQIAEETLKGVDSNNVNRFGFYPSAIKPTRAAVPLRSNMRTYGPYASPGFGGLCGGGNAEQDTDLAPWVYGGINEMNVAGNIRASSMGSDPISITETGSYTTTEIPTFNLGASLGNGAANLTGVTVNFGSSGITTTYSFQTHTPKFGTLSRNYLERFKDIQKNRRKASAHFNKQAIDITKINRRLNILGRNREARQNPQMIGGHNRNTLERVFVGEMYDNQNIKSDNPGQRTVVGLGSLDKTVYELRYDYAKKAYMSIDGILSPVATSGVQENALPVYSQYDIECHKSSYIYPQPPFTKDKEAASGLDEYNLEISQKYTNPLFNPGDHHHEGKAAGHSIDLVGRNKEIPDEGMIMNFTDDEKKYTEDYRFLGLRGPMVLHAWGYDTQGKPIPNAADVREEVISGKFKNKELKDQFLKDWLQQPKTWPVAPIDLRFDRNRGVWVSPPSYKIVVARLIEDLEPYGKAKAKIINKREDIEYGPKLYDKDGNEVKAEDVDNEEDAQAFITIVDRIGKSYSEDDKVYAYYDTYRCEYIPLISDDQEIIKFALVENKDIKDRYTKAVIVDLEGYPIKKNGERLDKDNFKDNWITVFDSFAIHGYSDPEPSYHNFGTTAFGPALGSEDWNEHMQGIKLDGGDEKAPPKPGSSSGDTWTGGPFIGYAVSKPLSSGVSSEYRNIAGSGLAYEMFYLESFAQYIQGKIGTLAPIDSDKGYYYGALRIEDGANNGFVNGRIPFTRDPVEPSGLNVRIKFPLDQHSGGKYITGDFKDDRIPGKLYKSVDGCKFVAKLDHVTSKVNENGEKLYYTIVECENIANKGATVFTKKEKSDELNKGSVKEQSPEDSDAGIFSTYQDGFMWDPKESETNYKKVTIINRADWTNKALIMKYKEKSETYKHVTTHLVGYEFKGGSGVPKGTITYKVNDAGTIAQVGEGTCPSGVRGKLGAGQLSLKDRKIEKFTDIDFYHGIKPNGADVDLKEEDQPTIDINTQLNHKWMTYEGAPFVCLWDEYTNSAKIQDAKYSIVYSREAPVIITGKAKSDFKPDKEQNISIDISSSGNLYSSCPNVDSPPMPDLLTKVRNPMGYGAKKGDFVTIQRVFSKEFKDNANYYYIVIGTGKPPEDCGSYGGSSSSIPNSENMIFDENKNIWLKKE